ncbi:MAG: hypothetical protein Q9195_008280 [Heterodermia aff. obscurata]
MPIFNSLRSKARKNSNKLTSSNQSTSTPLPPPDMKRSTFGSIFSKSPSTRRPAVPAFQNNNQFTDPSIAPPAYSAAPPVNPQPQPITVPTTSSSSTSNEDTDFSFLSTFDTVFLIDDSGSMAGRSWRETADALKTITPICTQHDRDGIDIYFLNEPDSAEYRHVTSPSDVEAIFNSVRPRGGTPTGSRLHAILKPYLRELEQKGEEGVKPLNIIVVTDGQASDDVESVILSAARRLDRLDAPAWQVGVQFFQVGEDREAKRMLEELDDALARKGGRGKEVRDMVDTVPWVGKSGTGLNGRGILKCVLGAVVRRHDDAEGSSTQLRPGH